MEKQRRSHHRLVLVPLPFQDHINPMLQLGSILHFQGFSITVVHTAFNSPNPSNHPEFHFVPIPDNLSDEIIFSGNLVQQLKTYSGLYPLIFKDLPIKNFATPEILQLISNMCKTRTSSAVIWNTVDVLEKSSLQKIQKQCQVPIFPIGPLHKVAPASSSSLIKEDNSCIAFDKQIQKSVLYVSLGSVATIDKNEVVEMAWGLANSKQPFLWVIRPGLVDNLEWNKLLPEGFIEASGDNGCIVKWAPQTQVLAHGAGGGFWTHCGRNSTLDSISEGVPMICKPCFGDQRVNARYICHVWKIGLQLDNTFERGEIERAVKRLMVHKEGEEMRQRAKNLKEIFELCNREGGSSYNSLNQLIELIISF